MKRLVSLLFVATCFISGFAQEPVLSFNGDLYFIPGSMTKDKEAFLVSVNSYNNQGFTIYDGDFNVVKEFTDPAMGQPYQQRVVTLTRVCDPGYSGGSITRAAANDEWTVVDDQTNEYTTGSTIQHFELYSDNNSYHSRGLYVSQTLFDNDDDFEYVRSRQTIVPISMKYADYVKEHSTGNSGNITNPSYGDQKLDSIMRETGADNYEWFWDDESGKRLLRLYKHEQYGGIYNEGIEIASLDGTVKAFLPGISYISSAYYFREKCYVQGYGSDNTRVLYLLGNDATGVREVSSTKTDFTIRRVGNNLVFDNATDGQMTLVVSAMDGRIVRSLNAGQGNNQVSVSGLLSGVYNVTLYQQSKLVNSSKIIIKN